MKFKAQSLIEFAAILLIVTLIAVVSLQIISNKINASNDATNEDTIEDKMDPAGRNCEKNGFTWDNQNKVCY